QHACKGSHQTWSKRTGVRRNKVFREEHLINGIDLLNLNIYSMGRIMHTPHFSFEEQPIFSDLSISQVISDTRPENQTPQEPPP
ncbi:MAG: hypothetical protein ACOC3W_11725, partial [Thermodesulfobacteriota bacterium]